MSVIASLTMLANHPIKTNISKIGKVKNRLFSLLPHVIFNELNTHDLSRMNSFIPGGKDAPAVVLEPTRSSILGDLFFFLGDCFSDIALKFVICSQVYFKTNVVLIV